MNLKVFILFVLFVFHLNTMGQESFTDYLNYFTQTDEAYTLGSITARKIPDEYALKYICDGDSSKWTYIYEGINQDTGEVVYKIKREYKYYAYAKIQLDSLFILVYDGYTKCEDPEFTGRTMIGLFNIYGNKTDEMEFNVVNNEGIDDLIDKTGKILEDKSIEITIPMMEKIDGKKVFFSIIEHYVINEDLHKFELISRDTIR